MLSRQEEEQERRETLENDLRVLRERGSTFHQHAQSQASDLAQGRFAATGAPRVVGSTPSPASQYPAASAALQSDPVGVEPPLGIDINAMPGLENPTGVSVSPPVATGAPAVDGAPPSALEPRLLWMMASSPALERLLFPRTGQMTERARPDLASAMYPSLSREAKAREAAAAEWRAEQQRRNQQLAADLRAIHQRINERLQREGRR
jgi:hypothetical protein